MMRTFKSLFEQAEADLELGVSMDGVSPETIVALSKYVADLEQLAITYAVIADSRVSDMTGNAEDSLRKECIENIKSSKQYHEVKS